MAHRPDGIADLVGDACRQSAERGELALLDSFRHETRVLEKYERRPGRACAEGREMRLNHACSVGGDEARWLLVLVPLCRHVLNE